MKNGKWKMENIFSCTFRQIKSRNTFDLPHIYVQVLCTDGDARRVVYIGEGGFGVGCATFSASPMPDSFDTFLAGTRKVYLKISPQMLWNVEK